MGRYSDSDDDDHHRRHSKKSKKLKRSRSRSRTRERKYEKKKSKSHRHRSRSLSKSRHRHRSRSSSPRHRSSRSSSTSHQPETSTAATLEKTEQEETKDLLQHMSKTERLEYKLQKALHAAERADVSVREKPAQGPKILPIATQPLSVDEQMKYHQAVDSINQDSFVQSAFTTSRTASTSSAASLTAPLTMNVRPTDAHSAAMFGTVCTSRTLLGTSSKEKIDLARGVVSSTLASAAANKLKLMSGKQLAGPNLLIPLEIKERRYLDKLRSLRQRFRGELSATG